MSKPCVNTRISFVAATYAVTYYTDLEAGEGVKNLQQSTDGYYIPVPSGCCSTVGWVHQNRLKCEFKVISESSILYKTSTYLDNYLKYREDTYGT